MEHNLYLKYSKGGELAPQEAILMAIGHLKGELSIYNFISDYILANTKILERGRLSWDEKLNIKQDILEAITSYASENGNNLRAMEKLRKWSSGLEAILY